MSEQAHEHELRPVPPPADAEEHLPVVRVLKYGRVETPIERDFELDEELTVSFKDAANHFVGPKTGLYVSEISDRSMRREGQPPWIKRQFILRRASS